MFEGQWNAFLSLCVFRNCYIVRVIIYCDGETSEISLTTRALIYAELMGRLPVKYLHEIHLPTETQWRR